MNKSANEKAWIDEVIKVLNAWQNLSENNGYIEAESAYKHAKYLIKSHMPVQRTKGRKSK